MFDKSTLTQDGGLLKLNSASEQKDLTALADQAESDFLDKVNAKQTQATQNTSSPLSGEGNAQTQQATQTKPAQQTTVVQHAIQGLALEGFKALSENQFDDLISFDSIDIPEIDTGFLPNSIRIVVDELSQKLEVPPSLVLVPLLGAIGILAQQKYRVRVNDSYFLPLCIYTLAIAPPANRKTAVLRHVTENLDTLANDWNADHHDEIKKNQLLRATYASAIASLRKQKGKAIEDAVEDPKADIEAIHNSFAERIQAIEEKIPAAISNLSLYTTGDTTQEALFLLSERNGGYLGLCDDEGKVIEILSGLYSGSVDTDFWTKSYDASTVTRARASELKESDGKVRVIPHSHLSVILLVQPSVINDMANLASRKIRGRGLFGRFLIAYPQTFVGFRENKNIPINKQDFLCFNDTMKEIFNLELQKNDKGYEKKNVLYLSGEADSLRQNFIDKIEKSMRPNEELSDYQDWFGKIESHLCRVAALLSLFGDSGLNTSGIIDKTAMSGAIHILDVLTKHTLRFFDSTTTSDNLRRAIRMVEWISESKEDHFTFNKIWSKFMRKYETTADLAPIIDMLVERHYLYEVGTATTERVGRGRPRGQTYFKNPKLTPKNTKNKTPRQ